MKWLLVTTKGKNPGDEFIRIGVQKLIRVVDSNAIFILIDKENDAERKTIPQYDRVVWCGMPVFWSNGQNRCYRIKWWPFLLELGRRKEPALIAGAGSFCHWTNDLQVSDIPTLQRKAKEVGDLYWKVYARDSVVPLVTNQPFQVEICPAAFAVTFGIKKELKLCNLMPLGAHYAEFNEKESKVWRSKVRKISNILMKNGFLFVAHSKSEEAFAKDLGWGAREVVCYVSGKPEELASLYSRAACFVGNRVHGAICSASAGAEVMSIGFDSRQEAVRLLASNIRLPSLLLEDEISLFASKKEYQSSFDVKEHWNRQLKIFQEFGEL